MRTTEMHAYGRSGATLHKSTQRTDAADTFEYDDAGRIKSWRRTGFGSGEAAYGFDVAGNLTSKTLATGTTSYSYNAGNQLTTETSGSIETTHAYDEFGRLVRSASPSSVTTYTWDPLGHLSQVATEGAVATYEYGISGMRERKTVVSQEGTRTIKSVWAGMQLVAELDSDGTRYEYIYGGGMPLELVVTTTGTGGTTKRYAYQIDAGGSVIGITNEAGAEVARYAYDPYGVPTGVSGTDPLAARNPLRYRGYYFDAETGMYYLPARYYEPGSARFLSVDPAPPKAEDAPSANSYVYCRSNPITFSDPDGRDILFGSYYSATQRDEGAREVKHPCDGGGSRAPSHKKWKAGNGESGPEPTHPYGSEYRYDGKASIRFGGGLAFGGGLVFNVNEWRSLRTMEKDITYSDGPYPVGAMGFGAGGHVSFDKSPARPGDVSVGYRVGLVGGYGQSAKILSGIEDDNPTLGWSTSEEAGGMIEASLGVERVFSWKGLLCPWVK